MLGIKKAEHVVRQIDDHVLKAAAGAEQWNVIFPGMFDDGEHVLHIFVGAAGSDPETLVLGKGLAGNVVAGNPFMVDLGAKFRERVLDGAISGEMWFILRRELANDCKF